MSIQDYLGKADIFVFVERRGVPALEDVVDGQGGAPAVVDAPRVAHRLTYSIYYIVCVLCIVRYQKEVHYLTCTIRSFAIRKDAYGKMIS